jgi:molecular chaperone DnaK
MSRTIDIGIDLGTTNSAISHFKKGEVKIFRDPSSWKDTIPSAVSYQKDRIIVGEKAKKRFERDPKNTFALFKRKMGTSETFKVDVLNQSKTPIELSAQVLKELRAFVTDENIEMNSAVITIPASFDTIQSNATKEAGNLAGFDEVVLLQEPIAASLAYANSKSRDLENVTWLVFDYGGGTFDTALLQIKNGEMKVIDHEGDNFLGGADFDMLIVEKVIVPHFERNHGFSNLLQELQNASGKYNRDYFALLHNAEMAKIELSTKSETELEVRIGDVEDFINLSRSEFEKLISKSVDKTIDLLRKLLTNNNLRNSDVDFALMVGGSTYIPYVRNQIKNELGIDVNTEIDPTTAVALGASFYAGTKKRSVESKNANTNQQFKIKMAYQKATLEEDEPVSIRVSGENLGNYSYRIVREDSGYDSGLRNLKDRIFEDLPLIPNAYNFFRFTIYDNFNNVVQSEAIDIAHGKYGISGQPIPADICLEVDDFNTGKTKLELVFKKNDTLPLRKTVTKEINKTIKKESFENLVINVLEGSSNSIPEANKPIGLIELKGADFHRDIVKGSDLEITLEIDESRNLTISAFVNLSEQEFKETFNPQSREVNVNHLSSEVGNLRSEIDESIRKAQQSGDVEKATKLQNIKSEVSDLKIDLQKTGDDDVTDKRYQSEDKKRNLAQEFYEITKDENISDIKQEYLEIKEKVRELISRVGDNSDEVIFGEISSRENIYFSSNNISKIDELKDEMFNLQIRLLWKDLDFVKSFFASIVREEHNYKDNSRAEKLIEKGVSNINNLEILSDVTHELLSLLPDNEQGSVGNRIGFY